MNKFVFSFIFILFSLNLSSLAFAQEQPRLAFGSIYYTKAATVVPGSNFSYDIYFFVDSEYGDRTAHISVSIEKPEGWNVYVVPEIQNVTYNISGVLVGSMENLYVEPRPKLQTIPEPKEEGIYYIPSPSGKGYLQAKKITIYVEVPENAEIGKSYLISATATANYFGELGSVMFSQSRGFDFTVTTKPAAYSEQIVKQEENKTNMTNTSIEEINQNISNQPSSNESQAVPKQEENKEESTIINNILVILRGDENKGNTILNYIMVVVLTAAIVYALIKYTSGNKKYKNYKVKQNEDKDSKVVKK